jgi:hypothetical protein
MADATDLKCAGVLGSDFAIAALVAIFDGSLASHDRAKIVLDCRMAKDAATVSSTIPVHVCEIWARHLRTGIEITADAHRHKGKMLIV